MTKEYILNYLKQNKKKFLEEYNIVKIGLFGSYVRNEQNKNSDIDILIEFRENTTNIHENKVKLKQVLENHFNLKVDLAREKYLKTFAKNDILNEIEYI